MDCLVIKLIIVFDTTRNQVLALCLYHRQPFELAIDFARLAIGFRRMHDLEKPGWYFLIPVYGFILSTLSGNPRRNKYGQDPKLERLYEREKADYHLFL
ncbi:MAG: DUF805 domain-containing protein [Bacteroidetes bacterium]|nr:DUF805 domain-containing protein [Bacteroidota bacterium]